MTSLSRRLHLRESVELEVKLAPKRSEKSSGKRSEKTDVLLLERLEGDPGMTISELAEQLELSTRAIEKQLRDLQESGRLRRVGSAKGGHWEGLK